jgi:hypothetical protein
MTLKKKMKVVLKRLEQDGYITHQFPCECCGEPIYVIHNPAFPLPNPADEKQRFIINDHLPGGRIKKYAVCFTGGAEDAARITRRFAEIGAIPRNTTGMVQ